MLLKSAFQSSWSRRSSLSLIVLTIALCFALITGVDKIRKEVRDSFARSVSGTDLIVGARGGDLQLLLYSVFHIGEASLNISWDTYQLLENNRHVKWAEPILLGDSHRGYRVVGTRSSFFDVVKVGREEALVFQSGKRFEQLYETVLGAEVAKKLGYEVGDEIVLSHGTGRSSFSLHDDKPFRVSGILKRTGTPVDHSLYVSPEAITAIHIGWQSGTKIPGRTISAEEAATRDLTPDSVTSVLIGVKSKLSTFKLQRLINQYKKEPLQAVLPGVALHQLWQLVSVIENALILVSAGLVVTGFIGMLSTLLTSLNNRRREMAIYRALGARPRHIIGLLVFESTLVTLLGIIVGYIIITLLLILAVPLLQEHYGLFISPYISLSDHWIILITLIGSGAMMGLWPGIQAYRKVLINTISTAV